MLLHSSSFTAKTQVLPAAIEGIESLWAESLGCDGITIAVLDGSVDTSHPCFDGAQLTQISTLASTEANEGFATQHGTHVTSIIFGQHGSSVQGIAPHCRGLIVPIFTDGVDGKLAPCSQVDLARAITQAVEEGADIINISGGQLTTSGEPDGLLVNAIRHCEENQVLIVAAAGNDGCDCLHIPAAIRSSSILAVGAMDAKGRPIDFSNWGQTYQSQGILALGKSILGAKPSGGTTERTGTSFATPIVSGIVALLLSIQKQRGQQPDPYAIRSALLQNAASCNLSGNLESQRCLVGTLNIPKTYHSLNQRGTLAMSTSEFEEHETISQSNEIVDTVVSAAKALISEEPIAATGLQPAEANIEALTTQPVVPDSIQPSSDISPSSGAAITASTCDGGSTTLVFALGQLGTDFGSEARRDSFMQAMAEGQSILDYLTENPWAAQSLTWTLNLDATPVYAIQPMGPYASIIYEKLREYLADPKVEMASIPGYTGSSTRLMSGQQVPLIAPDIRGMYSWSTDTLAEMIIPMVNFDNGLSEEHGKLFIEDYLNRVYYQYRNLGITPQERALNYSATNAFQVSSAIFKETGTGHFLDSISVEKSPICRPDSDCYDVKLRFFDPENNQRAKHIHRFTVDVSDVIPVTVGKERFWSEA